MSDYPVIAWENVLSMDGVTVTRPADAAGFPFQNALDWRDYTHWRAEASSGDLEIKIDAGESCQAPVDCLAIAGHDLASSGVSGLALKYSDDDSIYHDCMEPAAPEDDSAFFCRFPVQSRRYFKLVIPDGYSAAPRLGVLFVGQAMEIPAFPEAGFDPDGLETAMAAETGRTGRLLGVAQKYSRRRIRASFDRLDPGFIEEEWSRFWRLHGLRPFFFAWDPARDPRRVALVRSAEPGFSSPYQGPYRSLAIEMISAGE